VTVDVHFVPLDGARMGHEGHAGGTKGPPSADYAKWVLAFDRPAPSALPRRWERSPERHRAPRRHLLGDELDGPGLGLVGESSGRGESDGFGEARRTGG
jgi:hypothetical protein